MKIYNGLDNLRGRKQLAKERGVPVMDMCGGHGLTTNMNLALCNGYIGELHIRPTPIADAVNLAIRGKRIQGVALFYYGTPDDRLKRIFGYE